MLIKAIKSKIITSEPYSADIQSYKKRMDKKHKGAKSNGAQKLLPYLFESLKKQPLKESDILVITSKVLAVVQGRVSKITGNKDFEKLVKFEADRVIGRSQVMLTLKNDILIPWAGIDRSNIQQGFAVLWPLDTFKEANDLHRQLQKKFRLKKLGIIISDSTCSPLRKGVRGIALGYAGFKGVNDLRGKKDLYGNVLKVTQQAVADNLATAANIVMGESNERTPFAIIRGAPATFIRSKIDPQEPLMSAKDCLFSPLYQSLTSH